MNLKRHHVLYVLLALALVPSLFYIIAPRVSNVSDIASSTPVAIQFEVVTSQADQERGLGGRPTIPSNYGMLFVFQAPGDYGFWMKDMRAPIDILWLSDTGEILKINANVLPETYPTSFYPPRPVRYVLEMKAREAERLSLTPGTILSLPLPYGK